MSYGNGTNRQRSLPRPGEQVAWNTTQGETHGTVDKIVTGTTQVRGHTAKASPQHPQVLVRSDKSGKQAIHKPQALRRK